MGSCNIDQQCSLLIEKKKPHESIHHAEFRKYAKFHKNPLEAHRNIQIPKNCQSSQIDLC